MKYFYTIFYVLFLLSAKAGLAENNMSDGDESWHTLKNQNAFSYPAATLSFDKKLDFIVGKGFFKRLWVSAPASTQASDGLGPLFNARACISCHPKNGRGTPNKNSKGKMVSLVMKVDIPPTNQAQQKLLDSARINNIPEPNYGLQIQNFSIQGHKAEAELEVNYREIPLKFSDGTPVYLYKPEYELKNLQYGKLDPRARLSPRIAQQLTGLGYLEKIAEKDILNLADPEDNNNDGISGKANRVLSRKTGQITLGRFGHKAGTPNVDEQAQSALFHDIGISTRFYPQGEGDCTHRQIDCVNAINGNSPQYENLEASRQVTDLLELFVVNLAVPKRRNINDAQVIMGQKIFNNIGCDKCHTPEYQIKSGQEKISPFTDLLLHDMGPGLADNRPEGRATGREWRTAPLWGIGLSGLVNGHEYYLHDGRARSLMEAILWHGGEAENQKRQVLKLDKSEREQLIKYIESL